MAKYLYVIFPMFAALLAVNVAQAESPTEVEGATTVDEAAAKALLDRGVPFVDVRRASSYYDGHIAGAVSLHWVGKFTEAALGDVVTKDQEVVIYAWHHIDGPWYERSSESCKKAVSWGFKKVYYLPAGYPGWKAAGYPSE